VPAPPSLFLPHAVAIATAAAMDTA